MNKLIMIVFFIFQFLIGEGAKYDNNIPYYALSSDFISIPFDMKKNNLFSRTGLLLWLNTSKILPSNKSVKKDDSENIKYSYFNNIKKDTLRKRIIYVNKRFKDSIDIDFSHKVFNNKVDFYNCVFINNGKLTFKSSKFNSICAFERNTLRHAQFRYSTFNSYASFKNSSFTTATDFYKAQFDSTVKFNNSFFNNVVDFRKAYFNSTSYFINVKFDSIADFKNAEFTSKVNFQKATLPDILILSDVKTNQEIDLTSAKLKNNSPCKIKILNTDINKIRFRYKRFKLLFPEETPSEIKSNVYQKLIHKQKKEGFISSVEKLDKEYQEFKYLKSGNYSLVWGHFKNWLKKNWWGYGYEKELIILNTFILFLTFVIINTFILNCVTQNIYHIPYISQSSNTKFKSRNNPWVIVEQIMSRFARALLYTGFIFFGLKFDIKKLNYKDNLHGKKIINLIYFFLIYIIGLICIGYLANFVLND
ncbi:MAG: pentapeptide repeat-containing protein [Bacteroidales bacterium]|nr:pentapeptide repeat-containing protein [Bacteroidales bacterium]